MNRFVGLSLMCLMFLSAQAESGQGESEFRGSSWSLQLSQDNGEPIKVKSERKEYDKTGVTLHRKSQGIIENGVYKPVSEQDLNNPSWRRARIEKNRENVPYMKHHPRRYGKNFPKDFRQDFRRGFRKNFRNDFRMDGFGKDFRRDFRKNFRQQFEEDFNGHEPIIIHPHEVLGFDEMENMSQAKQPPMRRWGKHHPAKFTEKSRHHPQKFSWRKHSHPMVTDRNTVADHVAENSMSDNLEDKLRNRSRVSFYRPVEKLFEKLFGVKKRNDEKKIDLAGQNQAETAAEIVVKPAESWKDMPEFDDNFFDDEYFEAEE